MSCNSLVSLGRKKGRGRERKRPSPRQVFFILSSFYISNLGQCLAPSGVCGSGVQHSCVHLIGAVSVLASSRQGSLFSQPGLRPGERGGAGEKAFNKRDMFVVGEYGAIGGVLCGGLRWW